MTQNKGIDYSGPGATCNRDPKTGIRYGIICVNDLNQDAVGDFEPDYGDANCPNCENGLQDPCDFEDVEWACKDFCCPVCKESFWSEDCFGDEPIGCTYDNDGYQMNLDSSNDVWVFKSPYFTYAQFCSPCAPGACHLNNPLDEPCESNKCYCLDASWFYGNKAPYPVYSVETGKRVIAVEQKVECPNCKGTGRDTVSRLAEVRGCSREEVVKSIQDGVGRCEDFDGKETFKCWPCDSLGYTIEHTTEEVD